MGSLIAGTSNSRKNALANHGAFELGKDAATWSGNVKQRATSVRGALQEQLRKTEEAYAKYGAQKQDDPAPPKDRDR